MTLLYKCKCGFKFDIKLKFNEPMAIECPNCERKWYVRLENYSLSAGKKYYKEVKDGSAD